MKHRIITLTLNPAMDVSAEVAEMAPYHKLRCENEHRQPGGGGINVARAAQRLGARVLAIHVSGGATGQALCRLLDDAGLAHQPVVTIHETRVDFAVSERKTGAQFRFVFPSRKLSPRIVRTVLARVQAHLVAGDTLVVSGSVPEGTQEDIFDRLAALARAQGCRYVVDTSGAALKRALAGGPDLIKPNQGELAELIGRPVPDAPACVAAARDLIKAGKAKEVAISLGEAGALLVTADKAWQAKGIAVKAVSTVGAGDSFLAGLVTRQMAGDSEAQCLAFAVAAGTAALLAPGTELSHPDDIARFLPMVDVRETA